MSLAAYEFHFIEVSWRVNRDHQDRPELRLKMRFIQEVPEMHGSGFIIEGTLSTEPPRSHGRPL